MLSIPEIRDVQHVLGLSEAGVTFIDYSAKYLTSPGENYGSTMLALEVFYEENGHRRKLDLVAKLCPPSDILKEAFLTSITFKKEASTYLDVIPAIQKFETEFKVRPSNPIDVFAKCYGARTTLTSDYIVDNDAAIILENLKIRDYVLEDRMKGFDLETSELIVRNLAQLQATIVAMRKLKPSEFKKILPSLTTVNNGTNMVDGFVGAAMEIIKTIKECQPFWPKLKQIVDERNLIRGLQFPVETNSNFYTFVHTDLWTNNIMILRDQTGKVIKSKIVDFQFIDYGSPIRDLLFLLYTSVQIEVCDSYLDKFIKLYYSSFIDCLIDFDCELQDYSWENYMNEVNDVAPHVLYQLIFMMKPIFSEKGSIESLANVDLADFARIDNVGDVFVRKLKQIILSFAQKGWI